MTEIARPLPVEGRSPSCIVHGTTWVVYDLTTGAAVCHGPGSHYPKAETPVTPAMRATYEALGIDVEDDQSTPETHQDAPGAPESPDEGTDTEEA